MKTFEITTKHEEQVKTGNLEFSLKDLKKHEIIKIEEITNFGEKLTMITCLVETKHTVEHDNKHFAEQEVSRLYAGRRSYKIVSTKELGNDNEKGQMKFEYLSTDDDIYDRTSTVWFKVVESDCSDIEVGDIYALQSTMETGNKKIIDEDGYPLIGYDDRAGKRRFDNDLAGYDKLLNLLIEAYSNVENEHC